MKSSLVAAIGLAAVAIFGFSLLTASTPNRTPPCYTIKESKFRGAFVCSATFTPNMIKWKGKEIVIKEAWFERAQERVWSTGPLRSRLNATAGFHLCVNLTKGWDAMGDAKFVKEGEGRSFGSMGTMVLWETFSSMDAAEYTIFCTNNWKFENALKIKVTPDRPVQSR